MRPILTPAWGDILLTALAPILWGTTYIVAAELLPPDRPYAAAVLRVLPAGLLLILWMRIRPLPGTWGRLLVLSALNIGVFQALLFIAAFRLPGGLAAVVGAIQPVLIMGLAWLVERLSPLPSALVAAAMGVVGMALLLLSPTTVWDPVGIGAALGGAVCMAAGTYLTRRWQLGMPVLALTGWQLALGGLMLLPVACIVDFPLPPLTAVHIGGYAYLALAGTLLGYSLWFRGTVRLSPVAVSSLGLLSPLTAVILGWTLLGQAMTGVAFVGLVMVLISVLAVQWLMSQRR